MDISTLNNAPNLEHEEEEFVESSVKGESDPEDVRDLDVTGSENENPNAEQPKEDDKEDSEQVKENKVEEAQNDDANPKAEQCSQHADPDLDSPEAVDADGSDKENLDTDDANAKKTRRGPRFNCSQCDKSYKSAHSLRRHENRHQGIEPHQCRLGSIFGFVHE